MLFSDVPEIEIEISHRGLTCIAHDFHILDDCGAGNKQLSYFDKNSKGFTNQNMLLPEPAAIKDVIRWRQAAEWDRAYVFHESRGASRNLLTSIPYNFYL